MKPYNLELMKRGLQEVARDITGKDITQIAAIEIMDQSTVREYLKGKVAKPAIGKAVLERCRAILKERERERAKNMVGECVQA